MEDTIVNLSLVCFLTGLLSWSCCSDFIYFSIAVVSQTYGNYHLFASNETLLDSLQCIMRIGNLGITVGYTATYLVCGRRSHMIPELCAQDVHRLKSQISRTRRTNYAPYKLFRTEVYGPGSLHLFIQVYGRITF